MLHAVISDFFETYRPSMDMLRTAIPGSLRHTVHPVHKKGRWLVAAFKGFVCVSILHYINNRPTCSFPVKTHTHRAASKQAYLNSHDLILIYFENTVNQFLYLMKICHIL